MKRIPVLTALTARWHRMVLVFGALLLWTIAVFGLVPNAAQGAVPRLINFQGVVKDSTGNPPLVDQLDLTFTIYDAPLGGVALWTETQSITNADGGLFSVLLGSTNPIPDSVFKDTVRYIGIKVFMDQELSPRQRLVSVGYAYRVGTVDGATGGTIFGNTSIQSDLSVSGNILLPVSTATEGVITSGGTRFIHRYGPNNTFIGLNAGNLTMTGLGGNTAIGRLALADNTTGQSNTASGHGALFHNTSGFDNTASGAAALEDNTTGVQNTACGGTALRNNRTGSNNTAIGFGANVSDTNLTNATAVGNGAIVNASNKIRLGNGAVTVIEGQVAYTFPSDKNQKENFRPVDGAEVLKKIRGFNLASWNYKGHDPKQFRHYGPMAQEFFAAFGDDGVGKIGTETTLNSGDMAGILMIAVQTLENRTAENVELKDRIERLEKQVKKLQAEKPQAEVE